jgi:hypothetical protein
MWNIEIDKNFDEFTKRIKDVNNAEKMIAKKYYLDLMRIFGIKKVKLIDISKNKIQLEYRVDSQYVYSLTFLRTSNNKVEFVMRNIGRSLSDLWNNKTFKGIQKRIIDNWD